MFTACSSDEAPVVPAGDNTYSNLVLRVSLPGTAQTDALTRADDFDVFVNERDKWGIAGENIESLRVMILDSKGNVEVNAYYPELTDATQAGKYEYRVLNHDTKTIILLANEEGYTITTPDGQKQSAFAYFDALHVNSFVDMTDLQAITLSLADNADTADSHGQSLRKPLPISAIHTERIDTDEENEYVEREYVMHRAAVKYSFRVINNSVYDHTLEGIRINRVADREFLFPNAKYTTNDMGHQVIESYQTPDGTVDGEYSYEGFSVKLDKQMSQKGMKAREVACIYVPEGKTIDELYKVSITLNGAPLDMWGELKWRMPGQADSEATNKPMTDLPRNTHVVVNITIKDDNTMDFIAVVQPYSSVELKPFFGLERDQNGNVIVNRYPDGTFDVIVNGDIVRQDVDGDNIMKWFKDGSVYCYEEVLKDYIHDDHEVDYTYYFEKDRPTTVAENGDTIRGSMIIIREKSTGGTYHGESLPDHEHDNTDRALYILTKDGDFDYINYNEGGRYQRTDMFGDTILQVNGYQFRNEGAMRKYIGTYVVKRKDNGQEELRHFQTGAPVDWDTGLGEPSTPAPRRVLGRQHRKSILHRMQKANARLLRRLR